VAKLTYYLYTNKNIIQMSTIDPNKLLISSDFYSVQGEGKSTGVPSYFIRLGLCNLTCGMSNRFLKNLINGKELADGEIFKGDLELEGKATWTCDSTSQWAWRGENKDFQYLIDQWKEQGIYQDILDGTIHLIWTGGEPAMKKHQEAICNFFKYWNLLGEHSWRIYNEIETNGTIYIDESLFMNIHQINCSPKLENSGLPAKQRIKEDAIKRIMEHKNYQFKFVISTEEDVLEVFRDFVEPFNIPLKNVVCMPGLDDQANFHERTQFVLEMAKKYKFTGLTRLHISAWDKTLNV
jgi:organic radical activating enzyme